MAAEDLPALMKRNFQELLVACPPNVILAFSVVVVEGVTSYMVYLSPEVEAGGPGAEELKSRLSEVIQGYVGRCPNVVRLASSRDAPS